MSARLNTLLTSAMSMIKGRIFYVSTHWRKGTCQHFHVTAHCSKCETLQCIAEKSNRWYMVL